jgi:hypothetical protein
MCCFCHAQLFEITRAKNIKSPLVQRSCQNAEVVQAFCRVAASRSNTPSINSPAVRCCTDIARRLMLASRLPSRAAPALNPDSARCLAGAQLPATSFFGGFRTPAPVQAAPSRWAGIRNPCMGPIGVKWRSGGGLSHFVTSPDCICGNASPLLGCAERSSPKAACGAPEARA